MEDPGVPVAALRSGAGLVDGLAGRCVVDDERVRVAVPRDEVGSAHAGALAGGSDFEGGGCASVEKRDGMPRPQVAATAST